MPLSSLMNDQVTLVKQDGTRVEKIKAAVQPKLVLY
jgi:superfamily II DNA helicase RecQ